MESSAPATAGPVVRIVQPNVPQAEKWRPEGRARELQKLIDLSRRDGFDRVAAVVWPETATPFIVQPGSAGLPMLATAAPPGGYLLAGAARSGADFAKGGCWQRRRRRWCVLVWLVGTVAAHPPPLLLLWSPEA
jgi:apolipoprotein N-acyltransferase